MKKLWIVMTATTTSTLDDICVQVTPKTLALMVRGGLDPEAILDWTEDAAEANQLALQELYRVQRRPAGSDYRIKPPVEPVCATCEDPDSRTTFIREHDGARLCEPCAEARAEAGEAVHRYRAGRVLAS